MIHNHESDGLTPEKIQLFVAGLSGLSAGEVQKAKLLFIKNQISELRALKISAEGFGVAQGCFAIIPIFWPILWAQRSGIHAGITLQKERISNAIDVWREDLGEDAGSLEEELSSI